MSNLIYDVRRFLADARRNPARAVGEALDELERAVDREFDGAFVAQTSPVARDTWMARAQLAAGAPESAPITVPLGEPVEIVGFLPTVLALGDTPPPPEAIDVWIEANRRDTITARAETGVAAGDDIRVVNLPMISAAVANRLIGWRLTAADPTIAVKFRWAVPLATVAAQGWSDAQVSLGLFVRPIEED